jgi:hypothetical protein
MGAMKSPRKAKPAKTKPGECTSFQLHKSQQTIFSGIIHDVFDFTEHKLIKYIDGINEPQEIEKLNLLLQDYLGGKVAVAWNKGEPVSIPIVKG